MIANTVKKVTGISHPLISDMYLKKDFSSKKQNILVIRARSQGDNDENLDHDAFDSYLVDLLTDLEELKNKVQKKVGKFSRVDILTS